MSTKGVENYLRLHLLNVEGGTPVLRQIVLRFVQNNYGGDICTFLWEFKLELDQLRRQRVINDAAYFLLFPPTQTIPNIDLWDTTLLSCILLHCCTHEDALEQLKVQYSKLSNANGYASIEASLSDNKLLIDEMKGNQISDEQYDRIYPKQNGTTRLEKWSLDTLALVTVTVFNTATRQTIVKLFQRKLIKELNLKKNGSDLTKLLLNKKNVFGELNRLGKITETEFKELFPSDGLVSDMYAWDMKLLLIATVAICPTLSDGAIDRIKTIRSIRNKMIAHVGSAEIDDVDFLPQWTDMYVAITVLIDKEIPEFQDQWDDKISYIRAGPLSMKDSIEVLKEYYMKDSVDYKMLLATLNRLEVKMDTYSKDLEDIKQEIGKLAQATTVIQGIGRHIQSLVESKPDMYEKSINIKCVDITIVLKGQDEEELKKAEKDVYGAMGDEKDDDKKKLQAVQKVIETITQNGSIIVQLQKGSIKLKVKCFNLKAVTQLLVYIESEDLKSHLNALALELSSDGTAPIEIFANVAEESLQTIKDDILARTFENEYRTITPTINYLRNVPATKISRKYSLQCESDEKISSIASTVVFPTGEVVVCDRENKKLKLFDKHCNQQSVLKLKSSPFDSCLSGLRRKEIIVTKPSEKCIVFVSVDKRLRVRMNIDLENEGYGVASTSSGIAVTVKIAESNWEIHLVGYDGIPVRRINEGNTPGFVLRAPLFLTSIIGGQKLVISDTLLSCVTCVSVESNTVDFVYNEELKEPTNVACDNNGRIYVVDKTSDKIHMVSFKGKIIGDVLTNADRLHHPQGLIYNTHKNTLTLQPDDRNDDMCVYKISE